MGQKPPHDREHDQADATAGKPFRPPRRDLSVQDRSERDDHERRQGDTEPDAAKMGGLNIIPGPATRAGVTQHDGRDEDHGKSAGHASEKPDGDEQPDGRCQPHGQLQKRRGQQRRKPDRPFPPGGPAIGAEHRASEIAGEIARRDQARIRR